MILANVILRGVVWALGAMFLLAVGALLLAMSIPVVVAILAIGVIVRGIFL